jgi:hypothetical protein
MGPEGISLRVEFGYINITCSRHTLVVVVQLDTADDDVVAVEPAGYVGFSMSSEARWHSFLSLPWSLSAQEQKLQPCPEDESMVADAVNVRVTFNIILWPVEKKIGC